MTLVGYRIDGEWRGVFSNYSCWMKTNERQEAQISLRRVSENRNEVLLESTSNTATHEGLEG